MAEWPKRRFQIGPMFRGCAGTRQKSGVNDILGVFRHFLSLKEPQF